MVCLFSAGEPVPEPPAFLGLVLLAQLIHTDQADSEQCFQLLVTAGPPQRIATPVSG